MSDLATRREQLESVFGSELIERTNHVNTHFAALAKRWTAAEASALARELHGLKGAARAVEAGAVEQVAHAAEGTVLQAGGERPEQAAMEALRVALEVLPRLTSGAGVDVTTVLAGLATPRVSAPDERPAIVEQPEKARPKPPQSNEQGSVRVALGKLDTLLTESGELSVTQLRISERLQELRELQKDMERWQREWNKTRPARARLRRAGHRSGREAEVVLRAAEQLDRQVQAIVQRTRDLTANLAQNRSQLATVSDAISQQVMAIRLLPAGTMFAPFERLVRDLSRQIGKEARLELHGSETELDRRILDELRDPLMHMVRNSLDHGLEAAADRLRAGKPAEGYLRLTAAQRGDRVQITIEDDGRGLDVDAIRATAIRRGLVGAERADGMDTAALFDLIFHPGFSTRTAVTEISGRGVGMDVVRDHVARLGGTIAVQTTPGAGTVFTISVPLTLATTRVLLIEDAGQTYAVPSSSIKRTGRVRAGELHRLEGRLAVDVDGQVVPVVELSGVLQRTREELPSEEWRPFFVLSQDARLVALMADRLIDETELVVKGLGAPLKRVRHVSGAAVLGTGEVVVILNPGDLFRSSHANLEVAPRVVAPRIVAPQAEAPRRRVLVVDDSVMTRTLERTILESAGYSVVVATDGAHALELLEGTAVDAVVSDVEMPRMTGLELTAALRQDDRWRNLPVVLVTSLDAPEHVQRGAAAGANAYIVKGRFDQNDLLQAVGRLV